MAQINRDYSYFVGVDVGTGSTRSMLIRDDGQRIALSTSLIKTWSATDLPVGHYEQSSDDIWKSVCKCVNNVISGYDKNLIQGIAFDATCSLVVLDRDSNPTSVSTTQENNQNIILWMDHRAIEQANLINNTSHAVLKYVGNRISPEMEMPKILWLKQNLSIQKWSEIGHFMDLADFLTFKSTGSLTRSLCCLVCKWNFIGFEDLGLKMGWSNSFLESIGLSELINDNYSRIGNTVYPPGSKIGGLNAASANELGLNIGTPVATAMIDAHAGGVGMLGPHLPIELTCKGKSSICNRIGLICGTSTCHMAVSGVPVYAPGVWGPYYSAMVPGFYLNEAGQSAAGKLIDFVIESHPSFKELSKLANENSHTIYNELESIIRELANKLNLSHFSFVTRNYHVLPDFHGNRSPLARPDMTGMISGLELSKGLEDLATLYLATVQSLGYGSRHIIDKLTENGYEIEFVFMCGGLVHNNLYVQAHADILNKTVLINSEEEAVLMGTCILATVASGYTESIETAMRKLTSVKTVVKPNESTLQYHECKYKVFLEMSQAQLTFMEIMKEVD